MKRTADAAKLKRTELVYISVQSTFCVQIWMNVCRVCRTGKAVQLNSVSLSEWCMDNSPEVSGWWWWGVGALLALVAADIEHSFKSSLTKTLGLFFFLPPQRSASSDHIES